MRYVKIGGTLYPAKIYGKNPDPVCGYKESKSILLTMTYEEAKALFVDGLEWSIVNVFDPYVDENGNTVTPEPKELDNSKFEIVRSITDNLDGTVTVKMGEISDAEINAILMGGI